MTTAYRLPSTLITNESEISQARHFVLNSLKDANVVKIASGYAGLNAIQEALKPLTSILNNGGQVTLIFGLGYWEGISPALEKILRDFHKFAKKQNAKSGVFFCQKQRFHGKFYIFENDEAEWASIGSSNFSDTGFGSWLESNAKLTTGSQIKLLNDYFERLKRLNTKPIDLLIFPSRKKELNKKTPSKRNISIPATTNKLPITFKLEVKPQPKSHVNLFAGSGRKNSKGVYIHRPWYEIELGVKKTEMHSLRSIVKASKKPFPLYLVVDNGDVLPAVFKRKTGSKGSKNTILDGSDFMTRERIELGKFIKNKLIDAGVIKYGEPITADILDTYGNRWLEFRAIPGRPGYYHISF